MAVAVSEPNRGGASPESLWMRFVRVVLTSPMHGLDPVEWREVHNRRVHISVRVASLANAAAVLNALAVALFAIPASMSTFRVAWLSAAVLLMASSPLHWSPRSRAQDFVATTRDVTKLIAEMTCNVAIIGVVLFRVMPSAGRSPELILLTSYTGVMGCGAIVLSTYRSVALMWVWMTTATMGIAIWQNVDEARGVVTSLLVLYAIVLSLAIAFLSRSYVTRCRAELAARAERETVRTLLKDFEDDVNEWLWECGAEGAFTRVSGRFAAQAGRDISEIQGVNLVEFIEAMIDTATPGSATMTCELRGRFENRTSFRDLTVPVLVHGVRRWWSLTGHHVPDALEPRWRGIGEDVTAAKSAAEEILRLATTDALTGLMNRHRFTELLEERLRTATAPVHLAIVDLDNFKEINDTLGHPIGDQLLVEVGARLRTVAAGSDICARIGGDEFAIARCGTSDFSDALRAFDDAFAPSGTELSIRASIGQAVAPGDAIGPHDLVVAADLALYAAKAEGGSRVSAFDPLLAVQARRRASLFDELKLALARHEFVAWFQPQVNLLTGEVEAMEALARWRHPTRGIVSPGSFISLAEETGLITAISDQVMELACAAAQHWPSSVRLAVNVSARQLVDPQFVQRVQDTLTRHDLDPARLDIEVTETTMVQREASGALLALRDLGVGIAVDDFGTGYASFEALRLLHPSKLKVDKSFVAALSGPDPTTARAILRAFVALAEALHIPSVAEGAETNEQRAALRQLGFHYSQGFIDAAPAGPNDITLPGVGPLA